MGVAPGQTPWHPETPEQKMSDEKTFNADYFKNRRVKKQKRWALPRIAKSNSW